MDESERRALNPSILLIQALFSRGCAVRARSVLASKKHCCVLVVLPEQEIVDSLRAWARRGSARIELCPLRSGSCLPLCGLRREKHVTE